MRMYIAEDVSIMFANVGTAKSDQTESWSLTVQQCSLILTPTVESLTRNVQTSRWKTQEPCSKLVIYLL